MPRPPHNGTRSPRPPRRARRPRPQRRSTRRLQVLAPRRSRRRSSPTESHSSPARSTGRVISKRSSARLLELPDLAVVPLGIGLQHGPKLLKPPILSRIVGVGAVSFLTLKDCHDHHAALVELKEVTPDGSLDLRAPLSLPFFH